MIRRWLSREERRTLKPAEKRALRRERREAAVESEPFRIRIKWAKLEVFIRDLVAEAVREGHIEREDVEDIIDEAADKLDEWMDFDGFGLAGVALEVGTDILIHTLAAGIVRRIVNDEFDRALAELED